MITIVSSRTGQVLFTMDIDDGVVTLRPEAVRVALVSLQESGLSDHIVIRSQPNSARVSIGHLLRGAALRDSCVAVNVDCSDLAEKEEV